MKRPEAIKSLIDRIEKAESELELKKVASLLEAEEASRASKSHLYTLTLPIIIAGFGLLANAATTLYTTGAENTRADTELSSNSKRDEDTRRHDIDKSVDSLINSYVTGALERQSGEAVLCLHWGSSFLGTRTSETLQKIVQKDKLCGLDGGGFANLAVLDPNDADRLVKEVCIASPWIEDEGIARDQAGFHGRPHGKDTVQLSAPTGYFLGPSEIVSEIYRKPKGEPIREQLDTKKVSADFGGKSLPVKYTALVECTNDRGTGRTCESRVTVRTKTFPNQCAPFF